MNYISVLRDILKLNHDEIAAVSDDFESINAYLEAHQIIIPDDFQVTLCNHINVMLLRFKTNECAQIEVNEDVYRQVSKRSLDYAEECLTPICRKYSILLNQAEKVLFAIYLQTGISKEDGSCQINQ